MSNDPEVDKLIRNLKELDAEKRQEIHEAVYEENKKVSEKVRRNLSKFEDLKRLKESFLKSILRAIDLQVIATALQEAADELKTLCFKDISSRRESMLKDEIKYFEDVDENEIQEARSELLQEARRRVDSSRIDLYQSITTLKKEPENFESITDTFRNEFNNVEDDSIRTMLRETDPDTLVLALKGADPDVKSSFFDNLSDRRTSMIRSDIEYLDTNKMNIQQARQELIRTLRRILETNQMFDSTEDSNEDSGFTGDE